MSGRYQQQAAFTDALKNCAQFSVREVRVSKLVLVSCPGARALTYKHILGTDIRLREGTDISLPPAYMDAASDFAEEQTDLRCTAKGLKKGTKAYHIELWVKTVCTLQYSFWKGILQAPIHCEGRSSSFVRAALCTATQRDTNY